MAIIELSYQFTVDTPEDKELESYFLKRLHTTVMDALVEELPNIDIVVRWDKIDV